MSTHRTSSKAIATISLILGISVLLAGTAAMAAARKAGTEHRGFQTGSLRVDFIDATGGLTAEPLIDVTDAIPGMSPQARPISLRSTGTLAASYTVSSSIPDAGQSSLDDVLIVSVTDETGATLYRGKLSDLTFQGTAEAGQFRTYQLTVAWPATGNDNLYQGQSIAFALRADAEPTEQ